MKRIFPNELTRKSQNKYSAKLLQNMPLHRNTMNCSFWQISKKDLVFDNINTTKKYNKFIEINHKSWLIGATKAVFFFVISRLNLDLSWVRLVYLWFSWWVHISEVVDLSLIHWVLSLEITGKLGCLLHNWQFSGGLISLNLEVGLADGTWEIGNRNSADLSLFLFKYLWKGTHFSYNNRIKICRRHRLDMLAIEKFPELLWLRNRWINRVSQSTRETFKPSIWTGDGILDTVHLPMPMGLISSRLKDQVCTVKPQPIHILFPSVHRVLRHSQFSFVLVPYFAIKTFVSSKCYGHQLTGKQKQV